MSSNIDLSRQDALRWYAARDVSGPFVTNMSIVVKDICSFVEWKNH
jgi:hypothetical protein